MCFTVLEVLRQRSRAGDVARARARPLGARRGAAPRAHAAGGLGALRGARRRRRPHRAVGPFLAALCYAPGAAELRRLEHHRANNDGGSLKLDLAQHGASRALLRRDGSRRRRRRDDGAVVGVGSRSSAGATRRGRRDRAAAGRGRRRRRPLLFEPTIGFESDS